MVSNCCSFFLAEIEKAIGEVDYWVGIDEWNKNISVYGGGWVDAYYIIVMMCTKILILLGLLVLVLTEGQSIKVEGTRAGGFTEVSL